MEQFPKRESSNWNWNRWDLFFFFCLGLLDIRSIGVLASCSCLPNFQWERCLLSENCSLSLLVFTLACFKKYIHNSVVSRPHRWLAANYDRFLLCDDDGKSYTSFGPFLCVSFYFFFNVLIDWVQQQQQQQ